MEEEDREVSWSGTAIHGSLKKVSRRDPVLERAGDAIKEHTKGRKGHTRTTGHSSGFWRQEKGLADPRTCSKHKGGERPSGRGCGEAQQWADNRNLETGYSLKDKGFQGERKMRKRKRGIQRKKKGLGKNRNMRPLTQEKDHRKKASLRNGTAVRRKKGQRWAGSLKQEGGKGRVG